MMQDLFKKMQTNMSMMSIISFSFLFVMVLISLGAPIIAPYDPVEINMGNRFAPFSLEHLLGTDHLGRDVLSRLLYGGRVTMILAVVASIVTMVIGILIGTAAGYFGGIVDECAQFVIHLFQGLPGISFMLAIVGVLGPGMDSLLLAITVTSWADFSRIVRAEVLKIREEQYIEGIRAIGATDRYIIIKYIIPNLFGPTIVLFTVKIGRTMLAIAALSFLGLGLQPPLPDWGVMVNDARAYFRSNPSLALLPGMCIALVSLAINMLGDELRDMTDTKNEGRYLDLG